MAGETVGKNRSLARWTFAALGLTVVCYVANVLLGGLNQDEGWYLYAARQMMCGEIPHRDFFFTQGMVMPAVYACFGWLWSAAGVLGGRLFTAGLSLSALLIADRALVSCCSKADDRKLIRLVFFAFLGINLWYTYFTGIPKAYGLCTLLMAVGFRLLTGLREGQGIDPWCTIVAGVVFALLPDVRLSMGILLPVIAGWLFWRRAWAGTWNWALFSLAAVVTLGLLYLPELIFWPEAFWESCQFHAAREPMGFLGVIGCVARVMRFNPLLVVTSSLLLWLAITKKPSLKGTSEHRAAFLQLWSLCAGALLLVHLFAPVPYDDYQIPALLPLAMTVAFAFSRLPFDSMRLALAKVLVVAAVLLTLCASPVAQDWMVWGHDRFWVKTKSVPDLFELRRVGRLLRREAKRLQTDCVWTQDTYVAVEAGLRVPKGLEMGPFSKPQALQFEPRLAAWSGYTFAMDYPTLKPAQDSLEKRAILQTIYNRQILSLPYFGQGGTTLTIAERTMP